MEVRVSTIVLVVPAAGEVVVCTLVKTEEEDGDGEEDEEIVDEVDVVRGVDVEVVMGVDVDVEEGVEELLLVLVEVGSDELEVIGVDDDVGEEVGVGLGLEVEDEVAGSEEDALVPDKAAVVEEESVGRSLGGSHDDAVRPWNPDCSSAVGVL